MLGGVKEAKITLMQRAMIQASYIMLTHVISLFVINTLPSPQLM